MAKRTITLEIARDAEGDEVVLPSAAELDVIAGELEEEAANFDLLLAQEDLPDDTRKEGIGGLATVRRAQREHERIVAWTEEQKAQAEARKFEYRMPTFDEWLSAQDECADPGGKDSMPSTDPKKLRTLLMRLFFEGRESNFEPEVYTTLYRRLSAKLYPDVRRLSFRRHCHQGQ